MPQFSNSPPALPSLILRQFLKAEAPADFERALALRLTVFVEEQAVPLEEERDEADETALHFLVLHPETQESLATGRMMAYQEGCQMRPVAKIGRVAVSKSMRGQGLGEWLMRQILNAIDAERFDQAILDAQVQALPFYEKLGFMAEGDEFLDAGIPHYRMRLVLS